MVLEVRRRRKARYQSSKEKEKEVEEVPGCVYALPRGGDFVPTDGTVVGFAPTGMVVGDLPWVVGFGSWERRGLLVPDGNRTRDFPGSSQALNQLD